MRRKLSVVRSSGGRSQSSTATASAPSNSPLLAFAIISSMLPPRMSRVTAGSCRLKKDFFSICCTSYFSLENFMTHIIAQNFLKTWTIVRKRDFGAKFLILSNKFLENRRLTVQKTRFFSDSDADRRKKNRKSCKIFSFYGSPYTEPENREKESDSSFCKINR